VSDGESKVGGALSQLLVELAQVPRADVPDEFLSGLRPGTEVGRFIVEREIGRGGFGVVYAALDPELGRTVALKLLKPGSGLARKDGLWLRREAEAVARLNHAGIVTLHDFGHAPAGAYLVFELLRGETLARRIARGPVPLDEALPIALAVTRALVHAHESNVLHRDLKPANIHLGEGGEVKVLDFGIAHLFGQEGPTSGGTPAYMAPEQWNDASVDARADLFALGVLLLEMLTGKLPFGKEGARGTTIATALEETLPRTAAPRRLRRLIRALVEPDPEARPPTARTVLDELSAIEAARHEGRRPWRLVAFASMLLALLAGVAAWLLPQPEAAAGEQVVAAIADTENASGDPDLDRLGDLMAVALGESRRLRILSRERLLAAGRGANVGDLRRIDRRTGRVLAQLAGASVLLVPTVSRASGGLRVELLGEPPDGGAPVFTAVASAARTEELAAALDELVATARKKLRERREDLKAAPAQLAAMTTASLPAYRAYVEGLDCASKPSEWAGTGAAARCGDHFRRALGLDPGFALAHYQLALLLELSPGSEAELKAHMDAALRSADRLSRRDAALVRAWKDHLDGREEQALAAYVTLLADHPDDLHVMYLAGDLLFHRRDWTGATPYLERTLALDPESDWAVDHLAECYAATQRLADLRKLVAQLTALPPVPARLRVLVRAHVWLGDQAAAVAVARQAVNVGGGTSARRDLSTVLLMSMETEEADAILGQLRAEQPGESGLKAAHVGRLVAAGRLAEARRELDKMAPELRALEEAYVPARRALSFTLDPAYRNLAEDAERLIRLRSGTGGMAAVAVALFGDPTAARRVGALLPPGSIAAEEVAALLAWRAGDTAGALAGLTKLERLDPWPFSGLAPAYLIAEVASASGDPSEVIAAVARVQRIWPVGPWWFWARPRALLLAARAHWRLGQTEQARAELDRLLAALSRADRNYPLLAEARALRARLGSAPVARAVPATAPSSPVATP